VGVFMNKFFNFIIISLAVSIFGVCAMYRGEDRGENAAAEPFKYPSQERAHREARRKLAEAKFAAIRRGREERQLELYNTYRGEGSLPADNNGL